MASLTYGGGDLVTKSCLTLAAPWTAARQAPLSLGFSGQEHWSGGPLPPPGGLPTQALNPGLLHYRRIPCQLGSEQQAH